MRKHSALALTISLLFLVLEVNAQEITRSSIETPTASESIGTFNKIAYVRHRGRFIGQTESGPFDVPYEITLPSNPEEGNQICVFEPPHFSGGPVGPDFFFGSEFLFANGFGHASVGFGNAAKEAKEATDTGILREFALVLKQKTSFFAGQVNRIYAVGFSDSGNTVRSVYEPFGHEVFDLTYICTAGHTEHVKFNGENPIIVINIDADFDEYRLPDSEFSQYRYYAIAGGPHTSIAGTTPINWLPLARALFIAGDEWVRKGTPPPPSGMLNSPPQAPQ
ncbi:MAG TPA: alpha/beta hydrolase domain-containing protein [Pyrinomonadaceae bacterium]|nr:alpha/beta hydrolase domain-containing protein [Pyrinomonadaceae bacterium]